MANYHLNAKFISRNKGQSSVACIAYRAGEKLYDERIGREFDFSKKQNVVHSEILLPANAPEKYHDRATLWNTVEKIENRKDAQLGKEYEFSLPIELTKQQNIELARKFLKEALVNQGIIVDFAFHDKKGNPHIHATTTLRNINENGSFGKKNTDWNTKEFLKNIRVAWARCCNEALKENGFENVWIDHRSYKEQGVDKVPTIHEGHVARRIEKNGGISDRAEYNRRVKYYNLRHPNIARQKNDAEEKFNKHYAKIFDEILKCDRIINQATGYQLRKPTGKVRDALQKLLLLAQNGDKDAQNILGMAAQKVGVEDWQRDWFWMSLFDRDATMNRLGEDDYGL